MNISPYLKEFTKKFQTEFINIDSTPVAILKNNNTPAMSIIFYFHDGVAYEEQNIWGISHFIEHILLRGTETYPTLYDISRQVEGIGGQVSAYSTRDMVAFWIKTPQGYDSHALHIIEEILTKPALKEEFIQSERLIIQQERYRELNDPSFYSSLTIENLLLLPLPVSRHPVGKERVINEINSTILREHIKEVYHKNNLVISGAGNLSPNFSKKLSSLLKKFPSGEPVKRADFKVTAKVPEGKIFYLPSHHKSQVYLSIGWSFPVKSRMEGLTWRVLKSLLTFGYTSLLNNLLREKENITYLCSSMYNVYNETGIFKINLALADKNLKKALNLIESFFEDLKGGKIPEELLHEAIIRHGTNVVFMLDNCMDVAKIIGENLIRENKKFSFYEYLMELEKINMSFITELVRTHLIDDNRKIFLQSGSEEVCKCFPGAGILEKAKEGGAVIM
ncbi:MAG TPA: pitrilysin family protein [Candidatus Eremiobacteraeota bacterium]|nr:pitrilysin family protein [Candidatus Eremiobacteraeota bacterium]